MGFGNFVGNLTGGLIGESDAEKAAKDAKKASGQATSLATGYINDAMGSVQSRLDPFQAAPWLGRSLYDQRTQTPSLPRQKYAWTAPGMQRMGANPRQYGFGGVNIEEDPSYQFRLSQGLQAVNRAAAKNRNLTSGQRLLDLTNYAQGLASTEYDDAFKRQMAQREFNNRAIADQYGLRMAGRGFNNAANMARYQANLDAARMNNELRNQRYAMQRQNLADVWDRSRYLYDTGYGTAQKQADYDYRSAVDRGNLQMGLAADTTAADMFQAKQSSDFVSDLVGGVTGMFNFG